MKLDKPIEIDFLEFFRTGQFDYLKLGQSKEWILNNFPDPDELNFSLNIWQYGNIELHFYKDKLQLIYSDYLDELTGGKSLKLDKWILGDPEKLTLKYVIEKLNDEKIDFTLTHNKTLNNVIYLELRESKIQLDFLDYTEKGINANQYKLNSFSIKDKVN